MFFDLVRNFFAVRHSMRLFTSNGCSTTFHWSRAQALQKSWLHLHMLQRWQAVGVRRRTLQWETLNHLVGCYYNDVEMVYCWFATLVNSIIMCKLNSDFRRIQLHSLAEPGHADGDSANSPSIVLDLSDRLGSLWCPVWLLDYEFSIRGSQQVRSPGR